MRWRAWLVVGLVLAVAREARAEERDDRASSTPIVIGGAIEAVPFAFRGFNGVTLEVAPSRWASLEVGGGFWFYGPAALATIHVQVPIRRAGLGVEAGLLTGSFAFDGCAYDVIGGEACGDDRNTNAAGQVIGSRLRNAVFARVGPSFAWRSRTGAFQLRAFVGATTLLRRNVGVWVVGATDREQPGGFSVDGRFFPTMLYAGASLGYGLRL